jgi:hypothetical protein
LKKCMKHLRIEIMMPQVAEIVTNNNFRQTRASSEGIYLN